MSQVHMKLIQNQSTLFNIIIMLCYTLKKNTIYLAMIELHIPQYNLLDISAMNTPNPQFLTAYFHQSINND